MSAPGVNRPSDPSVPPPSTPPSEPSRPSTPPPGSTGKPDGTQGTKPAEDTPPPPPPTDSGGEDMSALAEAFTSLIGDPAKAAEISNSIKTGLDQISKAFDRVIATVDQEERAQQKADKQEEKDRFVQNNATNARKVLADQAKDADSANQLKKHYQNLLFGGQGPKNPNAARNPAQSQTATAHQNSQNSNVNQGLPKEAVPTQAKPQTLGAQPRTPLTPEQKAQQLQQSKQEFAAFREAFQKMPPGPQKQALGELLKGPMGDLANQIAQFEQGGEPPDPALSKQIAGMLGDKVASKSKDAKETTEELKKGEQAKGGGQVADSSTTVGAAKGRDGQSSGQGGGSEKDGQGRPDLSFKESIGVLVSNIGMTKPDRTGKDSLQGAQAKAAVRAMEQGAVACATARAVRMSYGYDGDDEQGSGQRQSKQDNGIGFGMLDQDGKLAAAGYTVDAAAAGLGGCYGVRSADGKLVPMWAAYGDSRGLSEDARQAAIGYTKVRSHVAAGVIAGARASQTGNLHFGQRV